MAAASLTFSSELGRSPEHSEGLGDGKTKEKEKEATELGVSGYPWLWGEGVSLSRQGGPGGLGSLAAPSGLSWQECQPHIQPAFLGVPISRGRRCVQN